MAEPRRAWERRNMEEILWGPTFGLTHILSLIAAAGLIVGLYFMLRKTSVSLRIAVLGVLSFSGLAAIIFNLVTCTQWGQSPWEYLPLHLCSINAILLPIAVFTRGKTVSNMLLLWSLGALCALIVNRPDYALFSDVFNFYYFPHVLEFGIPILLFKLNLVEKDIKCIGSTIGLTLCIYAFVHLCNLVINSLGLFNPAGEKILVNYMYSMVPEFSVLGIFWKILPHEFWYMLVIFPIIALYLLALYAPQILVASRKKNKLAKAAG